MTTHIAARWRDHEGVVHSVGMMPGTTPRVPITFAWRTYCYIIPTVPVSEIQTAAHYTEDPTTCLRCVVKGK